MTRCAGSDVLADSPVCPGCGRETDRYRDELCGRVCYRYVPHSRQLAEPPAELLAAIYGPQPRERSVPCRWCTRQTWNVSAVCDSCGEIEEHEYRRSEDVRDREVA